MTEVPLSEHDNAVKGIPIGSNRSVVPHIHFATGSVVTLVGRECPSIERASDEDIAIGPIAIDGSDSGRLSLRQGRAAAMASSACPVVNPTPARNRPGDALRSTGSR